MGSIIEALMGKGLSERVSRWIAIALVVLAILVLIAAVLAISRCTDTRQKRGEANVGAAQHGAQVESGADAVSTATGVAGNAAASEDLTRSNDKEIRNAPGANDPVNPSARDAGLRSLCRRAAYRDNPKCRVQQSPAR